MEDIFKKMFGSIKKEGYERHHGSTTDLGSSET